jgi:hypothetical protein
MGQPLPLGTDALDLAIPGALHKVQQNPGINKLDSNWMQLPIRIIMVSYIQLVITAAS